MAGSSRFLKSPDAPFCGRPNDMGFAILRCNPSIHPMSATTSIIVERVETKETTIKVNADTPEAAFEEVRAGNGREIGTVKKSELVIRDYPEETLAAESRGGS
jgi:hypothetical protein